MYKCFSEGVDVEVMQVLMLINELSDEFFFEEEQRIGV